MISLNKRQSGFTIVELLIVIVVIGILAAIVITTYGGIQSKARDAKRQSDMGSLQTQIEAFYTQNGYYPSNADMNNQTWLNTNMHSLYLNPSVMIDPSAPAGTAPSLALAPAPKVYAYQPLNSSGTSCEAQDTTCSQYTLTATLENPVNGSNLYQKHNLD